MRYTYCFLIVCCCVLQARAQVNPKDSIANKTLYDTSARRVSVIKEVVLDTLKPAKAEKKDSLVLKKKHDPNKATIRSAILPGWGQAYNREYWKIPLIYAAVGIPIGTYIFNNTWYKRTRDAYNIVVNGLTQDYGQINPELIYMGQPLDAASLQNYRNEFRKDRDYSILIILFAWGLNVVDATVFGHLKDFDVSSDLSMQITPAYDPVTKLSNLGFVFNLKPPHHKEALQLP